VRSRCAHTHKRAVLLALRMYGHRGLTAKQIEDALWRVGLRISGESVRGSICDLEREGEIQWLFKRPNPTSKCRARVWWTRQRLCEYLTEKTTGQVVR